MSRYGVGITMMLVLALSAVPAMARGPYFGGQAGAVFLGDADISSPGATATAEFDTGWGLGLAGGYDFDMFRLEGELFYKTNGIDTISGTASADGDVTAWGLMANGYYDWNNTTLFTPFIGAGIGFAQVSVDDLTVSGAAFADDEDTVFAYQLIAGVGYSLNKAVTVDLAYKYLGTSDPTFEAAGGGSFDAEYNSHNVMLGMRYNF